MFSQTGAYALRALTILARSPKFEYMLVGDLAESANLPRHYLGKILQSLARTDILNSRKGSKGGFRLARDPHTISLYEVIHHIDNLDRPCYCLMGQGDCSDDRPCALHAFRSELDKQYLAKLRETTLGDLAQFENGASTENS